MTNRMTAFQVTYRVHAEGDVADGELEAAAEAILDRLHSDAAFTALGPVMSVDFSDGAIEVEYTISAEDSDQVHGVVGRVGQIVLAAANAFEYQSSTTNRLEAAFA